MSKVRYRGRALVIDMLRNYEYQKMFCENLEDRKGLIKLKLAMGYDKELAEAELNDLEGQREIAQASMRLVDAGLRILNEQEKAAVREFYIQREEGHIDRICDELSCEERQAYKYKENGLKKICSVINGHCNNN